MFNGSFFDITMGSYDGADVCELVGLFILHQLSQLVGSKNIGLYRDNGLAILENTSGPTSEHIKKKIIKLFHQHSLNVTAKTNLVQTNFLDVTFNLWPYRNPNDQPLHVYHHSNHLPAIKKQLPSMLADCLSLLLYNHKEFARAIPEYEEAMQSEHCSKLQYISPPNSHKRKFRKQNIVWFNPPFSKHVKSNIGKVFIYLLKKHFFPHHCLHKICNKNNIKMSYSCMPNMAAI